MRVVHENMCYMTVLNSIIYLLPTNVQLVSIHVEQLMSVFHFNLMNQYSDVHITILW